MLDYLLFSLRSFASQKGRTALTLLGLIVGVASVVALISISEGMKVSISEQMQKIGANKISVFPEGYLSFGTPREYAPLREVELEEIRGIAGVAEVVPHFMRSVTFEYRKEKRITAIMGDSEAGMEMAERLGIYKIYAGRFYKSKESGAVILGYHLAKSTFSSEVPVGSYVKLNGRKFQVVGILREMGSREDDSSAFLPIEAARDLFDARGEITAIFVEVEDEKKIDEVLENIIKRLKKLRGGEDFAVKSTKQMAEQIAKILSIVSFVLGGIASVAILVGGVVIMNTMLTNVIERTQEIGVMKATGAGNASIMAIFLAESAILGMAGGCAGIFLGAAFSKVVETLGKAYLGASFVTLVSAELVSGALLFSLAIGIVSGLYPAYRAARLDPVEALRYE